MKGTYFIFDRLFYLMNTDNVEMKSYMKKWEVSRSTFFRDIEHLNLFYNISFEYAPNSKKYIRVGS